TLDNLQGGIVLANTPRQLTIDDRNDITANKTFTIGDSSSSILPHGNLSYAAAAVDYYLGSGGNQVNVVGSGATPLLSIHGNTGVDKVNVGIGKDIYTHTVRFEGQGEDSLTIDDSARTGNTQYTLTDSSVSRTFPVVTTVQYTGVGSVMLLGGQGDDV